MKTFVHASYSAVSTLAQKAEQSRQIARESVGIPVTVVPYGATGLQVQDPKKKKITVASADTGFLGTGLKASRSADKRGGKC